MKILSVLPGKKTMIFQVEEKRMLSVWTWIAKVIPPSSLGKWNHLQPCLARSYRLKTSKTYPLSGPLNRYKGLLFAAGTLLPCFTPSQLVLRLALNFSPKAHHWFTESLLSYTSKAERDLPALWGLQLDLRLESCPVSSLGMYSQEFQDLPKCSAGIRQLHKKSQLSYDSGGTFRWCSSPRSTVNAMLFILPNLDFPQTMGR